MTQTRKPVDNLKDELKDIFLPVLDLEQRIMSDNLTEAQVKEAFDEMLPPDKLFSPDIPTFPTIYTGLRDWL